jgi:hypothetical protein
VGGREREDFPGRRGRQAIREALWQLGRQRELVSITDGIARPLPNHVGDAPALQFGFLFLPPPAGFPLHDALVRGLVDGDVLGQRTEMQSLDDSLIITSLRF